MARQTQVVPSKARLSTNFIKGLPQVSKDTLVTDETFNKLKLKITPAGRISFLLRYRDVEQREHKLKIGDYPDLNCEQARTLAMAAANTVAHGGDPSAERKKRRDKFTLSDLCLRFMQEHAEFHLKDSTRNGYLQIIKSDIDPNIGKRTLHSLTKADFTLLHRDMAKRGYQANRTIGLIRNVFNWAIKHELYDSTVNPAQGIKSYREKTTEYLLSNEEAVTLMKTVNELQKSHPRREQALNVIKFLWLTGCRRSEAFKLKWDHVDLERSELSFIDAKSGDRRQPITSNLAHMLDNLSSKTRSDYVFPGNVEGQPLTDISNTWELVRERAGLHKLRLHDIRHNVISDIAAKYDLATAAAVGGHKSLRATERYIHSRESTTLAALEGHSLRVTGYTQEDLE